MVDPQPLGLLAPKLAAVVRIRDQAFRLASASDRHYEVVDDEPSRISTFAAQ